MMAKIVMASPKAIIEGEHLIGKFVGDTSGATLIVVGSVHGNEPGGGAAVRKISRQLEHLRGKLRGRVYFLAGNTRALARGVRFISSDLNRHWTSENLDKNKSGSSTDLGLTYIFREPPNYDRAVQEFTRSLEKDPNHKQTLQNITVAFTKKGDAAKAEETLARLEGVDPTNAAIPKLREEIQKLESK